MNIYLDVSSPAAREALPLTGLGNAVTAVLMVYRALDTMLEVPAVGASPAQTRAAVLAAMAGRVRGKAVYVGLYKRN